MRANALIAAAGLGGKKSSDHSLDRVSNIVFMGMGEPLANYARVMQAVRVMVDKEHGLGMSARGITVSTVGLVPAIKKLADEDIRSPSPSRCTRPTTACATSSSR